MHFIFDLIQSRKNWIVVFYVSDIYAYVNDFPNEILISYKFVYSLSRAILWSKQQMEAWR